MDRGEDPSFSHREIATAKCCWLDENSLGGHTETNVEGEIINTPFPFYETIKCKRKDPHQREEKIITNRL